MLLLFHLHECGISYMADEAVELADLAAAREYARTAARAIMSAEVLAGRLCLSCRIDIADEGGRVVASVPFREAVALSGL